jgi:hypothetical protein
MGFRFRRSVKILPGVRINLSKSSASVSLGGRGFHYTMGPKGTRVTAGIPGTGLSWTEYSPYVQKQPEVPDISPPPPPDPPLQQHHESLQIIQNASADQINALSTSELAPILDRANRRIRLAPTVLVFCLLLFFAALSQTNRAWVNVTALYAMMFVPIAIAVDRYRRSVKVTLDPEGVIARISDALSAAFIELMQCKVTWIVHAEGRTTDWKRNAGATSLAGRKQISLHFGKPTCIRGRKKFPAFHIGSDQLYLLPDAALAVVRGEVASVNYRELEFSSHVVQFIEEGRVPSDATIVEHTWRYVNKSGGPDRRFINNRQLPVCLYGEVAFHSAGGLNYKVQVSKSSAIDSLYKVIEALRQTSAEIPKSVTYIKAAKRWPTIAFTLVFAVLTSFQIAFLKDDALRGFAGLNSHGASDRKQTATGPIIQPDVDGSPKIDSKKYVTAEPQNAPFDLKQPPAPSDSGPPTTTDAQNSDHLLNLEDPQNVVWAQSRLRELGFLRGPTKGWDSVSRLALRDFKTTNNLAADDKWDLKAQELLASGPAFGMEQTFIGSWSESACKTDAKPDIFITSRRAVSSAGGICEFSNIRRSPYGWSVETACSNAGERWKASIHLTVSGATLIWTGRDGRLTQYHRCQ